MAQREDRTERHDLANDCPNPGKRPGAGEDPAKREQILDGAQCIFTQMGFDGASMNDITRAAGVSKGTLYVYFENKEALFGAMIERKRGRVLGRLREILESEGTVREILHRYGFLMTEALTSDMAIRGSRMVIGVVERMPELAHRYFTTGMSAGPKLLADYLEQKQTSGELRSIVDFDLAARQFAELCMAGLFRPRLFGEIQDAPTTERIESNVSSALEMFFNTYGVRLPE